MLTRQSPQTGLMAGGRPAGGTLAYAVSRRIPEIGLRMALGANRSEVIQMTFRESLTPVAIGLVVGLIGAFMLTPFIESML